jgi:hypothetical protein
MEAHTHASLHMLFDGPIPFTTGRHTADLQQESYASYGLKSSAEQDYFKWSQQDVEMCLRWRQLAKPLVIGIKGYTIYHGCAVMSCGDIVIAADDSKVMPSLVEYTSLPWDLALNAKVPPSLLQSMSQATRRGAVPASLICVGRVHCHFMRTRHAADYAWHCTCRSAKRL